MLMNCRHLFFHAVTTLLIISPISIYCVESNALTPCDRATYDAEHSILRTPQMLECLFESKDDLHQYAKCYYDITGIWVGVEKSTRFEMNLSKWIILLIMIIGVPVIVAD